jgi:hypothetical protein
MNNSVIERGRRMNKQEFIQHFDNKTFDSYKEYQSHDGEIYCQFVILEGGLINMSCETHSWYLLPRGYKGKGIDSLLECLEAAE